MEGSVFVVPSPVAATKHHVPSVKIPLVNRGQTALVFQARDER